MSTEPAGGPPGPLGAMSRPEVFRATDHRWLVFLGAAVPLAILVDLVVLGFAGGTGALAGGVVLAAALAALAARLRRMSVEVAWVRVTVRNPLRTYHLPRADVVALFVEAGTARVAWTQDRFLDIVINPTSGNTRTIRLAGVGPQQEDALRATLGLVTIEPASNVRVIEPDENVAVIGRDQNVRVISRDERPEPEEPTAHAPDEPDGPDGPDERAEPA